MFQFAAAGIVVGEAGLRLTVSLRNNRQRRNGYRRLVAPRTQPTRDNLPVILSEGEDQAQPGELPGNDDEWARLSAQR